MTHLSDSGDLKCTDDRNKVIKYLYSVYFLYLNFSEANFTGLMLPYM